VFIYVDIQKREIRNIEIINKEIGYFNGLNIERNKEREKYNSY
jgi:hypothetical protein